MSKWTMRGHFRYLRFKTFPMTPRTPQCEVFWALLSNPKRSGVPEDSKSPTLEVLGFTPTLGQSGVTTINFNIETLMALHCFGVTNWGNNTLWMRMWLSNKIAWGIYAWINQSYVYYQGLQDAIVVGDNNAATIGHRIILPSFFTGGPCHMVQNYQDTMAICKWARCPDAFVTFTCNPQWLEIKRALLPGQQP